MIGLLVITFTYHLSPYDICSLQIHIGDVRTQLIELLRKRLITTSRDLKGLFFQVVFPAIQILLILAILTVNINPAGRTLKMNASIFKFEPNTIVSGRVSPDSIESNLSTSRLIINRYFVETNFSMIRLERITDVFMVH